METFMAKERVPLSRPEISQADIDAVVGIRSVSRSVAREIGGQAIKDGLAEIAPAELEDALEVNI